MNTGETTSPPSNLKAPANNEYRRGPLWIWVLTVLSAVSPLACDMYLPGFPVMAGDFRTSAAGLQLTMTTFLLGLAAGQLVMGPLSDRYGRRRPLLWGLAACILAGIACALSEDIGLLIMFRFVQGLSGSACIVLSRAVVADSSQGSESQKHFSVMTAVGGLAPVLAPLIGTGIIALSGWRGTFWALVLITAAMLAGAFWAVPESLPVERRHSGGLRTLRLHVAAMSRDRQFVALALAFAFSFAVMFVYIPASPFVLQNVHGLGQGAFSGVFALNALGLTATSVVAGRLAGAVPPLRLAAIGVTAQITATIALLLGSLVGFLPTWGLITGLFVAVAGLGLVAGPTTALALDRVPFAVGAGAAVLGALQFGLGAMASPLVGLGGENTQEPMLVVMSTAAILAASVLAGAKERPAAPAMETSNAMQ